MKGGANAGPELMIQAVKDMMATAAPVLVVKPDHPSPSLVEFLGRLSIDAVWIDRERGAADLETVETVENMARAARLAWPGCSRWSRIFAPEDWAIQRYMFRGLDGLVVPADHLVRRLFSGSSLLHANG